MEKTITYSPSSEGWTSFWSYFPDLMRGMNNTFYTWKNGSLWEHDTNARRNSFYGVDNDSEVTTILNTDPTTIKMFKTIAIDSNEPWKAEITTDLGTGEIEADQFINKEGEFYAHIRRTSGDQDHRAISTQGIGSCNSVSSGVITFGFNLDSSISVGDVAYYLNDSVSPSVIVEIGVITAKSTQSITVGTVINPPSPSDFILYVKNSVAESFGTRGYYAEVKLTNRLTTEVELFQISSNVFQSNP